jgi:hypothetical protein
MWRKLLFRFKNRKFSKEAHHGIPIFDEQLISELQNKETLTERESIILHEARLNTSETELITNSYTVRTKDINGQIVFHHPDGSEHEPRINTILMGPYDRAFWANLLIACDGPDVNRGSQSPASPTPKNFGQLVSATKDLTAFYSFYRPMMIGDPGIVYQKAGRSPGYFAHTERLENPNRLEINQAIKKIKNWIELNSNDPEFVSVQINFMFSGHGYSNNDGESGIVIADGLLSSKDLATMLLESLPKRDDAPSPNRLDFYLDCCHAGAVASDIHQNVIMLQEMYPGKYEGRGPLGLGRVYCSCLDDEISFEVPEIEHGLFSFAFLNEYSRKIPDNASKLKLAMRDIGWYSGLKQHPVLIDFTNPTMPEGGEKPLQFTFPSLKLLTIDEELKVKIFNDAINQASTTIVEKLKAQNRELAIEPIELVTKACRILRDACKKSELQINKRPSARKVFSRKETFKRQKTW